MGFLFLNDLRKRDTRHGHVFALGFLIGDGFSSERIRIDTQFLRGYLRAMKDRFLLTDTFIESISLLDKGLKASLWKCLSLLSKNYFHPSLNTEKLNGIFSSRINIDYRLIHAPSEDLFRLLFAGKHEDAYRFADKYKESMVIMPEKRRSIRVAEPEASYSLGIEALEKEKKMQRRRLRVSVNGMVRKWHMFKIEDELVPGNVYDLKKLKRYFMKQVGKN